MTESDEKNTKLAAAVKDLTDVLLMIALFTLGFFIGRWSVGWQISAVFGS